MCICFLQSNYVHVYLQVNTAANVNPSSSGISSAGSGDSRASSSHRRPDEQALISLLSGGQVYIYNICNLIIIHACLSSYYVNITNIRRHRRQNITMP